MDNSHIKNCSAFSRRAKLAIADILDGIKNWRIWMLLSWQDIQLRYRRSTLGPFWITLSIAITISTTGFLYGNLFHANLANYYPHFAAGLLTWSFISISLVEGANIFVEAEYFIKQMKQPYSTYIFRVVARNFIVFLHNIVIFIPIVLVFHLQVNAYSLLCLLGFALIILNAISFGTILAICGTRFRDITQLINSMIQVIFFLTPIMWSTEVLPEKYHFAVHINPAAQFIEMVRNPLQGLPPSWYAVCFSLGTTMVSLLVAFLIFARFRARISYWL